MKTYTPPQIKAIILDQRQSILQTCKLNGGYFTISGNQCLTNMLRGSSPGCAIGIKGAGGENTGFSMPASSIDQQSS